MSKIGSRVIFVGNIPYEFSETQVVEIFSEIGQVVGFRLVFDRETGKPKGNRILCIINRPNQTNSFLPGKNADILFGLSDKFQDYYC